METENKYKEQEQIGLQGSDNTDDGRIINKTSNINLDLLVTMAEEKGFEVERNIDYGYGPIDLVWYINVSPIIQNIRCGFIVLGAEEIGGGGNKDTDDNQYSIRKIEEAAMRGIRSGMDKVFLVVQNQDMAKSVSGQIEWLASKGSLLRLDVISLGIYPEQKEPSVITRSQQRVVEGEKRRKEEMREREAKFDKYNRPKGERSEKESKDEKIEREAMLDEYNRPKQQKES